MKNRECIPEGVRGRGCRRGSNVPRKLPVATLEKEGKSLKFFFHGKTFPPKVRNSSLTHNKRKGGGEGEDSSLSGIEVTWSKVVGKKKSFEAGRGKGQSFYKEEESRSLGLFGSGKIHPMPTKRGRLKRGKKGDGRKVDHFTASGKGKKKSMKGRGSSKDFEGAAGGKLFATTASPARSKVFASGGEGKNHSDRGPFGGGGGRLASKKKKMR